MQSLTSPRGSREGLGSASASTVPDISAASPASPKAAAAAAAAEAALAGTGVEVHGLPPGLGHNSAANGAADAAGDAGAPAVQQVQARQLIGLPFERGDVAAETPRLRLGDEVDFRVTLDRRSGQLKATEVGLSSETVSVSYESCKFLVNSLPKDAVRR